MHKTLLLLSAVAVQPPNSLPDRYSMTCRAQASTGYNWRNGGYVAANFVPQTFVITIGVTDRCIPNRANDLEFAGIRTRTVCGYFVQQGDEEPMLVSQCKETYFQQDGRSSVSIRCESATGNVISADPDGWFHYSSVHSDTGSTPANDYKDSLVVSFGRCRRTR